MEKNIPGDTFGHKLVKKPEFVRTRSGRRAKFILEAEDEAESLFLIEHVDKKQELRRKASIEPVSRLHSRSASRTSGGFYDEETDFWESEQFEPAHVRTKSGREVLCIGVEDYGESFVVLEYPSGRTVVRDATSVKRLEKAVLLVTPTERRRNTEKLFDAVQRHSIFDVTRLIDREADVNGRDSIGFSPLLWSIQHNRYDIMNILLDHKADIMVRDNQGSSALIWALRVPCNPQIVQHLCAINSKSSFLNHRDELGRTPLVISCLRRYRLLAAILFNAGASVLPADGTNRSAVDWINHWGDEGSDGGGAFGVLFVELKRRRCLELLLDQYLPPEVVFLIVRFESVPIDLHHYAPEAMEVLLTSAQPKKGRSNNQGRNVKKT